MSDGALNGDLAKRVVMHTAEMPWQASPSATVERKRLHRVGPAESGQVTSVVRYLPGATFPAHDHPEGEEILVLDGTFSDEHGDWPAGTYLLNPEGFHHAPFSKHGCVLFVKLRQYAGATRRHVAIQTRGFPWKPGRAEGIDEKVLYAGPDFPDSTRIERWAPGAAPGPQSYPDGVEFFVLDGVLEDEDGRYPTGTWLRLPAGGQHTPAATGGCEVYVRAGGVRGLRSA